MAWRELQTLNKLNGRKHSTKRFIFCFSVIFSKKAWQWQTLNKLKTVGSICTKHSNCVSQPSSGLLSHKFFTYFSIRCLASRIMLGFSFFWLFKLKFHVETEASSINWKYSAVWIGFKFYMGKSEKFWTVPSSFQFLPVPRGYADWRLRSPLCIDLWQKEELWIR